MNLSVKSRYNVELQFSNQNFHGGINSCDSNLYVKNLIVGCTENGYVFGYDAINGVDKFCFVESKCKLTDISFSKVDSNLFCVGSSDGVLNLHDIHKHVKQVRGTYDLKRSFYSIDWNYDMPIFGVCCDKYIRMFDIRAETNLNAFDLKNEGYFTVLKFAPNNKNQFVAGDSKGHIYAFDFRNIDKCYEFDWERLELSDEEEDETFAHYDSVVSLCFSPSGRSFLSLDVSGNMKEWDIDTGLSAYNEYYINKRKNKSRKVTIQYLENEIWVPEENTALEILSDEKIYGHNKTVNGILEIYDGVVSYAADNVLCVCKLNKDENVIEDVSDWSEELL